MKEFVLFCVFVAVLAVSLFAQDRPMGYGDNYKFTHNMLATAVNSSGEVLEGDEVWTRAGGFQSLGSLGGTASGYAINDSGQVAGASTVPSGTFHAFLWSPSAGMQDLGSLLGGDTYATAINASGQVAGVSYSPDFGTAHAFFWSPGTGLVDVGTLTGDAFTSVSGLNLQGEIAGTSRRPNGTVDSAFRWTLATGIQALPGFGGISAANAINDSGQIAGYSTYPDGTQHAALWAPNGSVQDLGTLLGDTMSSALFLNGAGHIAGYSGYMLHKNRGAVNRTFFWTPQGGMIDLMVGTGPLYVPHALNQRDQVLAHGGSTYIWSPTLGAQAVAGGLLSPTGAFNDAGVFSGQLNTNHNQYLLTPVMHVTLTSSQNPSHAGQSVTFTVNVSSIVALPPDGEQVAFKDGSKTLGTGTLSNGAASFSATTLKVGTHKITAVYAGDGNYSPNTSAKLSQVVTQ